MPAQFADRAAAGRALSGRLGRFTGRRDVIVVGLARGGVPVACEIATALAVPLDVLVVGKIGVPHQPELAMGAVASDGTYSVQRKTVDALGITNEQFFSILESKLDEVRRRENTYRDDRPQAQLTGKIVILVDDGLATGASMRVALDAVHRQNAAEVVVAVPVAPIESQAEFASITDEIVCLFTPKPFHGVGAHYERFDQVDDVVVQTLLEKAMARRDQ